MTRHSTVEDSAELRAAAPVLPVVVAHIGYRQIRNRGTVGGSVCHADPAAEWPLLVRLLRADLEVVGPDGTRIIHADEFFDGNFTTTLADDEVLIAVRFRTPSVPWRWGFSEFAKRTGDFAIAAVGAILELSGDTVTEASLVAAGVGPTPVRLDGAEAVITGRPSETSSSTISRLKPQGTMSSRPATSTDPTSSSATSSACRWRECSRKHASKL